LQYSKVSIFTAPHFQLKNFSSYALIDPFESRILSQHQFYGILTEFLKPIWNLSMCNRQKTKKQSRGINLFHFNVISKSLFRPRSSNEQLQYDQDLGIVGNKKSSDNAKLFRYLIEPELFISDFLSLFKSVIEFINASCSVNKFHFSSIERMRFTCLLYTSDAA